MTQVFISYSRKDLTFIERLAADLKRQGFDVWYDLSNLDGGVRWNRVIEQAITESQYAIVVLSPDSVISEYVDDEISFARRLKKKIVPLYYRPCELGMLYVNLNYIDVQAGKYGENFDKILRALNAPNAGRTAASDKRIEEKKPVVERAKPSQSAVPQKVAPVSNKITLSNGMEFMRVPAGNFLMGSAKENKSAYESEKPQHTVDIPYDYWMARFPVTNAQYSQFKEQNLEKGKENHPVVRVSWSDAMAYCQWLNNLLKAELPSGLILRLPTEAEWEKAARGADGREYPWGNQFDKNKCNTSEGGKGGTTPVGLYSPQGDSPYGCADMAGNVWEWTHSLYKPYPYKVTDGREDERASGARALRGGSFIDYNRSARCACRLVDPFDLLNYHWGFRVAASPVLS